MKTFYDMIESPMGPILIASRDSALVGLWFKGQKYQGQPDSNWEQHPDDPVLRAATKQITEYYAGKRTRFDVPVRLSGTDFQQSVWKELQRIKFGETVSYSELAARLGKPKAFRAAAAAVGRNPASLVVPCHRVVGANGSLTGYAGGIERKQGLLALEAKSPQSH